MKRGDIIDLIREHYDPEPKDWPRHRGWDDGAEKIADEILKLSVLRGLEVARMLNPVEACPECGLKADTLLHKFCTHRYCPTRPIPAAVGLDTSLEQLPDGEAS